MPRTTSVGVYSYEFFEEYDISNVLRGKVHEKTLVAMCINFRYNII